jgi:hypothetical protein
MKLNISMAAILAGAGALGSPTAFAADAVAASDLGEITV